MKKIIILLSVIITLFAQGEQYEYEKNLNLGNSDTANYTIVTGDCLWDLAKTYYGDNYEWRYIWEHNRYIQDPHWIYPGNKLFIPAKGQIVSSDSISLYDTSKTLNQISDDSKKTLTKHQISLAENFKYYFSLQAQRQAPFIYSHNTKKDTTSNQITVFDWGRIVDGTQPLLIQHKDALVKLNENKADSVKIDDRLDFYEIRNNISIKGIKGSVIEPVATGVIKFIDGDNLTVFVDKIWGLLSVGARTAPVNKYKSLGEYLTYKPLNDSLKTKVIARMAPDISLKPGEFIFIDKGLNDGVVTGDHFKFLNDNQNKSKLSGEFVAEGLVITAEKSTATVRITAVSEYSLSSSLIGIRQGKVIAK